MDDENLATLVSLWTNMVQSTPYTGNLSVLSLSHNCITDASPLVDMLKHESCTLRVLRVNSNLFTCACLLPNRRRLVFFSFVSFSSPTHSHKTVHDIAELLRSLAQNRSLVSLNLSDNNCDEKSDQQPLCQAIIDGLQHNKTLLRLEMRNMGLNQSVARALAECLLQNQETSGNALRILNVSVNKSMTVSGVAALAEALASNQQSLVEELYLDQTLPMGASLEPLANMLRSNTS